MALVSDGVRRQKPRIVIVGAGPAGLAAAIATAQELPRAAITVLEQRSNLDATAVKADATFRETFERKNVLQANLYTLHQLERLGALGRLTLLKGLQRFKSIELNDVRSSPDSPRKTYNIEHESKLANLDAFETASATAVLGSNLTQHVCGIPIASLQQALFATAVHQGIIFVFDSGKVTVERDAEIGARVRYTSRDGEPLSDQADLLIIAEGTGRSITQQDLNIEPDVKSERQHFLYSFLISNDIGPRIFYNRKRSNDPAIEFSGCAIVSNTASEVGTIFYVQIPRPLKQDERSRREALEEELQVMREVFRDHLDSKAISIDDTVPITQFSVEVSSLPVYSIDDNIIVGDAARTGHFNSGAAFSVSLVCDINTVRQLVRKVFKNLIDGTADSQSAFSEFNDALSQASTELHNMELAFFYEQC
ncbi:hypothetical protein BZG36_01238 [Bifiguratus adelaidae]|uniref:FAD-binding domain-containing protein n=1 Tax=Bifiguratus adelaidae TaxID=1938954 RepID=A0A261Y5W2_9FUNG|nr:hypothetical protein BZG36_01238 [Bifiguratus adelaidae]